MDRVEEQSFQADRVAREPITRSFHRGERARTFKDFRRLGQMYHTVQGRGMGWYTRPLYFEKNEESLKTQKGSVSCSDFSFLKIP